MDQDWQDWNRDRSRRPRPEERPQPRGQRPPQSREELRREEMRRSPDERGTPPRKPRKRNRSLFPNPWVYLLFVFGVSAIMAALCWTAANDVLALNKEYKPAVVTIAEDASMSSVVNQLKQKGLIEYKTVFRVFAFFMGADEKIAAGTYELNTSMDYRALISGMSSGSSNRAQIPVTIPEGKTVDQIFQLLEEKGVCSVEKLREMASTHEYAFSFLQGIEMGDYKRLEGFLFPDTYKFYMGENPLYVINKMLANFDAKVTEEMRTKCQDMGYSVREMVTIASMIERETDGNDRANIASVIYNRLNSNATAHKLEIDATIQYVLPEGRTVTRDDYYTVESPYNTYLNEGLPPGPIGNPGMAAIYAALNPANTKYLYYSLGNDQYHHFFATYAEHDAFLNSQKTNE